MGISPKRFRRSIYALHKRHSDVPRKTISRNYLDYLRGKTYYMDQIVSGTRRHEYWTDVMCTADRDSQSGLWNAIRSFLDIPLVLK